MVLRKVHVPFGSFYFLANFEIVLAVCGRGHILFRRISSKRAESDLMSLLHAKRKSHMGSPDTASGLLLSGLERSRSRSIICQTIYLRKRVELSVIWVVTINRKSCV